LSDAKILAMKHIGISTKQPYQLSSSYNLAFSLYYVANNTLCMSSVWKVWMSAFLFA